MTRFTAGMAKIQNEIAKAYPASGRPMAKALSAEVAADLGPTMTGEQFLAKALEAVGRKHITTAQLTESEAYINAGKQPPAAVVKAVVNRTPYWPF